MTVTATSPARQLAERRFEHPLISAFLDLDPTNFATAPARATEINSLLDQAQQQMHAYTLEHQDRMALEQDIRHVGSYLTAELDPSGAWPASAGRLVRGQLRAQHRGRRRRTPASQRRAAV